MSKLAQLVKFLFWTEPRRSPMACINCDGLGIDVNCGGGLIICRYCAGSGSRGSWAIDNKGNFYLP